MKRYIIAVLLLLIFIIIIIVTNNNEYFENTNTGLGSFDKYLYINLNHREDRKKQILGELNKIGIPNKKIERIEAVHEKYNGHIGCAKSHIKALELAQKENLNNVVIFEDDFVFTLDKDEVNQKLNKFLEDYKENWDVLQLTSHYVNLEDIGKDYLKNVNSATAPSAYIIRKGFMNIIEAKNKMEEEMIEYTRKSKKIVL